jgi:hypothetical protein
LDPIATLFLARAHTVVLDPDLAASASTRPASDTDVDRFEDELLQLGFVLSLDLAMTVRRLPHEALGEVKRWIIATLAAGTRPHAPLTPLARREDPYSLYVQRVLTWLRTRAEQPCPWCNDVVEVSALDPCGHLVCPRCWHGGNFRGCPTCHRRVPIEKPFMTVPAGELRVGMHDGMLRVLHLAFDLGAVAKACFERLLLKASPLTAGERSELEAMIDVLGPRVAAWFPQRIPVRATMAIAVARLWIVASDRMAMMDATRHHLANATDVLRVAAVVMNANASLVEPMRLSSIPRNMRRALLAALEQLPAEYVIEDMRRHRSLWKRVGERLHPGEIDTPTVTAGFAAVRGTLKGPTWAGRLEMALAAGDARAAAALLAERPAEMLRRADHVMRVALAKQPDAVGDVVAMLRQTASRCEPEALLALAAHVANKPRLPADVIGAITATVHAALVARAARLRNFARAVIDRDIPPWEIAAIHAAARANTIYVRHGASIAVYKRRDEETPIERLARLHAGEHDGLSRIPPANAPTWFALHREDVMLPKGSEGYAVEPGPLARLTEADLVAALA